MSLYNSQKYQSIKSKLKNVKVPWGPVGYITYKRTYSRPIPDLGRSEEFHETIARVLTACDTQLSVGFTDREELEFGNLLMNLKCSVAGRFLWQLGSSTVDRLGLASLQNCAGVVVDAPIRPFTWTMDMLALGCGVGFNIESKHVAKIPPVQRPVRLIRQDTHDADFIVPDSREGWVKLLGKVLKAAFYGSGDFSYSTLLIRGFGAPIKGFGGVASGPEILVTGVEQIASLLSARAGRKLTPTDCLDIMNIIGSIIVAGNVRRSAELAVGSASDNEYLDAKQWNKGNIPNWRALSNNSIAAASFDDIPEAFWNGYNGNGEAYGLINLELSKKIGRLGDSHYSDEGVAVYNPCAEQPLQNYETCCLAEVFLPNIESFEEFKKVTSYLYRVCKHSLRLKCHNPETEEIVHATMRMGIGITGYMQATETQKSWLAPGYSFLRDYDKSYSKVKGWPVSRKLTTCKPSGTLSLLAGVTPGVHPGFSHHFIRRIRINSSSTLIPLLRDAGYPIEPVVGADGRLDHSTLVVSFPCQFPDSTVVAAELTARDQIQAVQRLQREWSDNAVSCTVYYRQEELGDIRQYLQRNYQDGIKTISFMLHSGHGFLQAPYEEISREAFTELKSKTRQIAIDDFQEGDLEIEECASGMCPVR